MKMSRNSARISVKTKLIGVTLAIVVCLGMVNVWNIVQSSNSNKAYYSIMEQIQIANDIIVETQVIGTSSADYIMKKEQSYLDVLETSYNSIQEKVIFLSDNTSNADIINHLKGLLNIIDTQSERIAELKKIVETEGSSMTDRIEVQEKLEKISGFVSDGADQYVYLQLANLEEINKRLNSQARMNMIVGGLASGFVVIISMVAVLIITNNITKPLQKTKDGLIAMAKGDLSSSGIQVKTHDEIKEMSLAYNEMIVNLRNSMIKMGEIGSDVHNEAGLLNIISDENASAGEEIASHLEKMVFGMKEQTTMAMEISDYSEGIFSIG